MCFNLKNNKNVSKAHDITLNAVINIIIILVELAKLKY